jgi:hypothetical protein
MAGEAMTQTAEREAIRAVLDYASKLVTGARDDVDAVLVAQQAVTA